VSSLFAISHYLGVYYGLFDMLMVRASLPEKFIPNIHIFMFANVPLVKAIPIVKPRIIVRKKRHGC
jgi:hypothetical protein